MERRILSIKSLINQQERLQEITATEQRAVKELEWYMAVNSIVYQMTPLLQNLTPLPLAIRQTVTALMNEWPEEKIAGFRPRTKFRYYEMLSNYYSNLAKHSRGHDASLGGASNIEQHITYLEKIIQTFRASKILAEEEAVIYNGNLDNLLNQYLMNNMFDKAEHLLESVYSKFDGEAEQFSRYYYFTIQYLVKKKEEKKGLKFSKEKKLVQILLEDKHAMSIVRYGNFLYILIHIYAMHEDYHTVLNLCRAIIDKPRPIREDIVVLGKLLEIICKYEIADDNFRADTAIQRYMDDLTERKKCTPFLAQLMMYLKEVLGQYLPVREKEIERLLPELEAELRKKTELIIFAIPLAWLAASVDSKGRTINDFIKLYSD
jgi:hypothetical protein